MGKALALALALSCTIGGMRVSAQATDAAAARADIKATFGFVPGFLNAMPDVALPGAWAELKGFELNPNTALPPKLKHAIGLAVAAQAGCAPAVYAHRQFAKQQGASDAELNEAVVMAALTRHWSTVFHGLSLDLAHFKAELASSIERAKQRNDAAPKAAAALTDAKSARDDIAETYGMVPEFMQRFPDEAIAGAWSEERAVEMSSSTALSGKQKSLISLAVSSQIPCRYCILADTEFAKLAGASDREISEAIASAAIARHWTTFFAGMELDEKEFRKDVDRIVSASRKTAVALAPAPQREGRAASHRAAPAPAAHPNPR